MGIWRVARGCGDNPEAFPGSAGDDEIVFGNASDGDKERKPPW